MQWFCTIIADRLDLTTSVEEHWRKSIGNSKIKCRSYFEKYLLPLDSPLALALDEVDRIFSYQEIASEFLGMLRTWHEDAKTRPLWRQVRLVLLYSEIYTEVDINQSPFNAGYEMTLTDFNEKQVLSLAERYGLNWDTARVTQLMAMVGGHPYLVGEALKQIAQQDTTLEFVLQTSHTARGIYSRHLERHWRNLQSNSELDCAFQKIVCANSPVEFGSQLNQRMAMKLNDLGLVKLSSNSAIPRYELYRQYFRARLLDNL
ncbi:MAG: AAA-like domain-containing protein [Rhizonema sp. PD38]|nr:AAA-like domain-containing protein [Rhizonema sp. PD38]